MTPLPSSASDGAVKAGGPYSSVVAGESRGGKLRAAFVALLVALTVALVGGPAAAAAPAEPADSAAAVTLPDTEAASGGSTGAATPPPGWRTLTAEDLRAADISAADGAFVVSVDSDAAGKCLDVYDWGRGPWIQMWSCHYGSNQEWFIGLYTYRGLDVAVFTNYASGKCMDGYRGRGLQVVQWSCDGSDEQYFIVHQGVDGSGGFVYAYENLRHRGQCLDVYDWGRSSTVHLWDCHFSTNQQWALRQIA